MHQHWTCRKSILYHVGHSRLNSDKPGDACRYSTCCACVDFTDCDCSAKGKICVITVIDCTCQIYGMENGTLNFHGRLQDVKEFNPELFTIWQEKIKRARCDLLWSYMYVVCMSNDLPVLSGPVQSIAQKDLSEIALFVSLTGALNSAQSVSWCLELLECVMLLLCYCYCCQNCCGFYSN